MGQFNLSKNINPNKVFIIQRGEIEGRLEAEYYRPEIRNLENHIRNNSQKKLKDFIKKIASGATPSVTEEDKYYTDKENGVPFLRVQNLQTNGKLLLDDDLKYINRKTHEGLLKRSQVKEHDLLVKITGVGRMAIASVAPQGFEGNTNQHMVVIKTGGNEVSDYLANYLNLDIAEKLATRRSTGATRPALDYPALKSIPIIEGLDFSILHDAEKVRQNKEIEAKKLLSEIDNYLLNELNISLPVQDVSLKGRIFNSKFSEVTGNRIDPNYNTIFYQDLFSIIKKDKRFISLKSLISVITKGETPLWRGDSYLEIGVPFLRVQNISEKGIIGDINYISQDVHDRMKRSKLFGNEILYTMAGSIGIATIFPKSFGEANINQAIAKIILKDPSLNEYISEILNCSICRLQAYRYLTTSAQPNINFEQIKTISVPLLSHNKQEEIVSHIKSMRKRADELIKEALKVVFDAKKKIESTIIN